MKKGKARTVPGEGRGDPTSYIYDIYLIFIYIYHTYNILYNDMYIYIIIYIATMSVEEILDITASCRFKKNQQNIQYDVCDPGYELRLVEGRQIEEKRRRY